MENTQTQRKRIDYLDGLKGFAAISVFIYHIAIVAFYNGFVGFGSDYASNTSLAKEVIFDNFLAAIFTNNNIGVYLFFTMIAIFPIINYRKHQNNTVTLGKAAIKRYLQLLAPCLVVTLLHAIFYWTHLNFFDSLAEKTNCNWLLSSIPSGIDTFWDYLYTVFISIWFHNSPNPLGPMWCMYIILFGSLAVYGSYALFGKSKFKYLPCIVLALLSVGLPFMTYFAIGSFLTEFVFLNEERKKNLAVGIVFIIVGLVILKLPVQIYPIEILTEYACGIGAGMIIYGVSSCDFMQKFFSQKWIVFLGKISFEIILVHFFVFSNVGALVYSWLLNYITSPYLLVLLTFIAILPLVIPLSYLLNRFVSVPVNNLLKKATDKLFPETK